MKKRLLLPVLVLLFVNTVFAADTTKSAPAKVKPVLVVMDVQNAYLPYMSEQDKKLGMEMINYTIALFRDNGFPVVRVYHTDPDQGPPPGSEAFEFPKTVAVTDDDLKIVKNYPSAFRKTELDKVLKGLGCNTVFLTGLSAVGCVLATYHGGGELDYQMFMVRDAVISHDSSLTKCVLEFTKAIDYYGLKLLLETARAQ